MGAKVFFDFALLPVDGPAQRSCLIDGVFDVQFRSTLDQQSHNRVMARYDGLMQGRRVGMVSIGVVPVWIFARIEEQPYDVPVPVLRG